MKLRLRRRRQKFINIIIISFFAVLRQTSAAYEGVLGYEITIGASV